MVVVAIAERPLEIGIDVEPLARGRDIVDVAHVVFSRRELGDLAALDPSKREDRAVAVWTLKESYIKARGMGLALPLQEISFTFDGDAPTVELAEALCDDAARWVFRVFDVEHHRVALSVAGSCRPLRVITRYESP